MQLVKQSLCMLVIHPANLQISHLDIWLDNHLVDCSVTLDRFLIRPDSRSTTRIIDYSHIL